MVRSQDPDCLQALLALLCDENHRRKRIKKVFKMRSFWSEFLTAAANHPFTAVPGDFLATYDTYHDYYDDDDDERGKTKDNQITRFPLTIDSVAQTRYRYHSNAPYLKSQDNDSPVTHAMYLLHPVRIAAQMSDRVYNSSYILSMY
ncbi:hypothetical protein MSG28_013042 [Choristoneura fumiferana]|uniref:Uncharacterized protein n=1 Tax=Choristoneura fumiferana TaxID=7141 RepID=A0ACC0KRF9_CHOFU|nr:hypothetical protein MSG28_013042 [Choristoneura fumiferana]